MSKDKFRLCDAKLGAAIDNACKDLPDDYRIEISLERQSGVVTLHFEGEEINFASNLESMSETINDAVSHAVQHSIRYQDIRHREALQRDE